MRTSLYLLRPNDQNALAGMLGIALLLVGMSWLTNDGQYNRPVHFESAPRHAPMFVVDLNRAGWPELSQLPGVGETLARRIFERREQSGSFRDASELRQVRGVGEKTLGRMLPHLQWKTSAND